MCGEVTYGDHCALDQMEAVGRAFLSQCNVPYDLTRAREHFSDSPWVDSLFIVARRVDHCVIMDLRIILRRDAGLTANTSCHHINSSI